MKHVRSEKKWGMWEMEIVRNEKSENWVWEIGKRKKNVGNGKCVTWSKWGMWQIGKVRNEERNRWETWAIGNVKMGNVRNEKSGKWGIWKMGNMRNR